MTIEYGLGMFVYGMIAIFIGATIAYFIINAVQKKEKEEKENENRKHLYN
jgi:large-conductance mechanosensitive channel